MKKQLPANGIANELAGSSVFFRPKDVTRPTSTPSILSQADSSSRQGSEPKSATPVQPRHLATMGASHHDPLMPRNRATQPPSKQPVTALDRQCATPSPSGQSTSQDMLEEVRKVVKQLGKEAATHRFSGEEKRAIADLVYTYNRQGYRTSENEITRIAVNWLLADYAEWGEHSILARMLELLHG